MRKIFLYLLTVLLLGMTACSPTRVVKPLPPGENQVSFSLGGPMISSTAYGPLPLMSASYARGITDDFTFFGGLHLVSAAYKTLHVDLGLNYGLLVPERFKPGISINGVLNSMLSFRDGAYRLYPEVAANMYWEKKRTVPYVGISMWMDPFNKYAAASYNKPVVFHAVFGNKLSLGDHDQWSFDTELKYGALNVIPLTVTGIKTASINGRGSLALFFGTSWRWAQ